MAVELVVELLFSLSVLLAARLAVELVIKLVIKQNSVGRAGYSAGSRQSGPSRIACWPLDIYCIIRVSINKGFLHLVMPSRDLAEGVLLRRVLEHSILTLD